jgi:hypothetical protein
MVSHRSEPKMRSKLFGVAPYAAVRQIIKMCREAGRRWYLRNSDSQLESARVYSQGKTCDNRLASSRHRLEVQAQRLRIPGFTAILKREEEANAFRYDRAVKRRRRQYLNHRDPVP